jgi:hypothetical protein
MRRLFVAVVCVWSVLAVVILLARTARAETLQAPAGGHAIALGEGRVACAAVAGDWAAEADPHEVRPPKDEAAIGRAVDLRVAPSAAACATTTATVTLVATSKLPAIDPASITLAVDEGRLDVKGRGLKGLGVRWQAGERAGHDRCAQPETTAPAGERCSFGVGRGLPADPGGVVLTLIPAGGRGGAGVTTFDATGRRVSEAELSVHPARIVVGALVPTDVSIDLVGEGGSRVPLAHPEAVASVDCGAASCEIAGGAILVRCVTKQVGALAVRLRLAPHVFFARGDALEAAPAFSIGVLPCAMAIASGDALRGVDGARVVVRLESRCANEARTLRFAVGAAPVDVLRVESDGGAAFVLLRVGRIEGEELAVTALRGDAESSVVGVARTHTRAAPQPRASIELEGRGAIDFIPTNRPALVRFTSPGDRGRLVLSPLEGAYAVTTEATAAMIRGLKGAAGFVALRFGYRVDGLPASLSAVDLAVIPDGLERPLREANVPAPLGASALGATPLVELVCGDGAGGSIAVLPGAMRQVPFVARDTCRLVLHRERLAPEDGSQQLNLQIDITRVDGTPRSEAHVSQPIVLRPGSEPRYAWIRGISGPFDHVTVSIAHDADESHYVGGSELHDGAPSVQYSFIAGTGHARIYATTAIPTGLYRVSDRPHSGILTLNFGVIARFTWLDTEGHEGFLGLEAGVMGVGLANDSTANGSLTQVATVFGAGLSVPIANRSLATETSINLHAWGEYEISRDLGGQPGSPFGFVFGPSISIGNIGANL